MAETTDQLIYRADVALHNEKYDDAKKYVKQAVKQISDEEREYMRTLPENDEEKELIATWYAQCAYIFFNLANYLESLSCSWKAAVFSEKMELNSIDKDERWIKLICSQPREKLLRLHQKLCIFLSNDLDESACLAFRLGKWKRCLEIDHTIDQIFIFLRDVFMIGPNQIWLNQGRHKAFKRMAKCYYNLNKHDSAREYCKIVLENLSEYDDIEILEIFARSLLATENFKAATERCKLAIKYERNKRGKVSKALQNLQAEIDSKAKSSTERKHQPAIIGSAHSQEKERQIQKQKKMKIKPKRRRPNRAKQLEQRNSNDIVSTNKTTVIYERINSSTKDDVYDTDIEENGTSSMTDTSEEGLANVSLSTSKESPFSEDESISSEVVSNESGPEEETSFYEKSKFAYVPNTQSEVPISTDEDLLDIVVNFNQSFLEKFEDRHPDILKRKKRYQSMQPISELKKLLANQDKYVKGTIQMDGPHEAVCIPTHTSNCQVPIKIQGRGKIGQTFNGDEVVVELIHDEKIQDKRFGVVIGILDDVKHENVKRKIFACTMEEESFKLVRPVCKSIPKIHVIDREISKRFKKDIDRRYKIELYNYEKDDGTLTFSKIVDLNKEQIKSSIFVVVYINWSHLHVYPRGAIIRILPMGRTVKQDLLTTNILHKVPFLYKKATVNEVECLTRKAREEPNEVVMKDRTDLCDLYTFTIDPPGSNDLDDALSVEDFDNHYRVGVHIADVSSYVDKGSSIDFDAKNRSQTFYSNIQSPRCMLPEPLSKNICSLLPNKPRRTLSIFFKVDKEILKRGEHSSILIDQPVVMKTFITSKMKLTYKETQKIIISSQDTEPIDQISSQVQILHKISEALRKRRLKNASVALETYFEESPLESDDIDTFEAHNLVEEFMILANSSIAEQLIKSRHGKCVPLRCHNPPSDEKINDFLKANESHIDIVCRLQDKQIWMKRPSFESEMETQNKYVMVFKSIWNKMLNNNETATHYLRKDDLHPLQFVIYQQWISIQEHGEYRCSGSLEKKEENHYDLDIFHYTTFTSPIRRYIDLVVHRLVHVALFTDAECPYSQDELIEICKYANRVSKTVKDYEKCCKTLKLESEIGRTPRIFTCYVSNNTDKDITLCTPSLKGPVHIQRKIPFRLLDMIEKPVIIPDHNTNSDSMRVVWKKRLFNFQPIIVNEYSEEQELNPNMSISYIPLSTWLHSLRSLSVYSGCQRELSCIDLIRNTNVRHSRGLADATTEHAIEIETDIPDENGSRKCLVFKSCTKFALIFSRGQRLDIQMTAVRQRGTTILKPSLINLTENVKFCLQHTDDPILYLSRYSSIATCDSYRNIKRYLDIWLPILSMEAAKCVVRNEESFTLIDRPVQFNQDRTGTFVVSEKDCEIRKIEFSGIRFEDESRNENNAPSYDWLCIKSTRKHTARNDEQCKAKYIWVGHAEITSVVQQNGQIKVIFSIHQTAKNDALFYNKDAKFNVEVLKKSDVDMRTESFIRQLEEGSLAAAIALRKPISELDEELVKISDKMDKDLFIKIKDDNAWTALPRNNAMQKVAITKALKSRFTLIQGPPGTGKTQTAIKLICLFTKMNTLTSDSSNRNQVLFCGPSNKSVDLVARWMLNRMGDHQPNFVRVYGETIELDKYPIPGKVFLSRRSTMNKSADPTLETVSLHNLIRKPGNKYYDKIKEYEAFFARYKNKRMPTKEKKYAKLIARASIEEMQKYDVILCTAAVGANPKLVTATNISQIIIDEAGMCPEPHCLVPIIATKAKQVVLIGDHKQLRPIIMCKEAAELGLETSLFERYAKNHSSKDTAFIMLNEQYRMHPQICQFPSHQFYEGALKTGRRFNDQDLLSIWPHDRDNVYPHVFVHIHGEERVLAVSTEEGNEQSRSNLQEVNHVVNVYKYLTRAAPSESVQILSQYNAQCHAIKAELRDNGLVDEHVTTVVSSQGGEWDYVIFSTVRSLPKYKIERHPTLGWCKHNLGFITDRNQVNVALTRAKKGLIIIGNKDLLSCDEVWKDLIDYYEVRGCVLSPENFPPPFEKTRRQIMDEEIQKHARRFGASNNNESYRKGTNQRGRNNEQYRKGTHKRGRGRQK